MADEITLIVRAKDLASRTFGSVSAGAVAMGNLISSAVTAAWRGLTDSIRGGIRAVLDAESADATLAASIRGTGGDVERLKAQYTALANAIQDQTGRSDEATKATIAKLNALGISEAQMASATRMVISMTSVMGSEEMALKAVAKAINGDIEELKRFVPQLNDARTTQEQMVVVNRLLAAGWETQKASLTTVGGAWVAFKGRISDLLEAVGQAVIDGTGLGAMLADWQARLGALAKSEGFQAFLSRVREAASLLKDMASVIVSGSGQQRSEVLSAIGGVILAAFKEGGEWAGNKINDAIKNALNETWVGKIWGGGKSFVKSDFGRQFSPENLVTGGMMEVGRRAGFEPPIELEEKYARLLKKKIEREEGGELKRALANLEKVTREAAANLGDMGNGAKETADALGGAAPEIDASVALLHEKNEIEKKLAEARKKEAAAAELRAAADAEKAAAAAASAAADRARDAQRRAEEIGGMDLQGWIAQQKAAVDKADAQAAQDARQQRLEDKLARGTRLSAEDQEWLDSLRGLKDEQRRAVQIAEDAKLDAAIAEGERIKAELAAEQARKDQLDATKDMLTQLREINKKLGLAP